MMRKYQVEFEKLSPKYIDADQVAIVDGALVFYSVEFGGKAGPIKSIIRAFGPGSWESVVKLAQPEEDMRH